MAPKAEILFSGKEMAFDMENSPYLAPPKDL
jgi:hypothetical protein